MSQKDFLIILPWAECCKEMANCLARSRKKLGHPFSTQQVFSVVLNLDLFARRMHMGAASSGQTMMSHLCYELMSCRCTLWGFLLSMGY